MVPRVSATGGPRPSSTLGIDAVSWALTALCALATVWFSFFQGPPGANAFPGADKAGHALAYFATLLSFLFAGVWRPGRGAGPFPRFGPWAAVLAVGAGIVIEILQGMTATRTADVKDVVAEVVGAAAAVLVHSYVRGRTRPPPGGAPV